MNSSLHNYIECTSGILILVAHISIRNTQDNLQAVQETALKIAQRQK